MTSPDPSTSTGKLDGFHWSKTGKSEKIMKIIVFWCSESWKSEKIMKIIVFWCPESGKWGQNTVKLGQKGAKRCPKGVQKGASGATGSVRGGTLTEGAPGPIPRGTTRDQPCPGTPIPRVPRPPPPARSTYPSTRHQPRTGSPPFYEIQSIPNSGNTAGYGRFRTVINNKPGLLINYG